MHTTPIQNTNQAVAYIQSLPINLQQELVDWINVFKEKHIDDEPKINAWQVWKKENQAYLDNLGFEIRDEPSELQKSFLEWEVYRQKMIAEYDENEMTDEEFDELLASLKDRNDTGRAVNFDD